MLGAARCLGEFVPCVGSFDCVLDSSLCGSCGAGEYVCPLPSRGKHTCVASADAYITCPGLSGTHLDSTLPAEARLDYLLAHTTLDEQINQLQNGAPALAHLGVPEYQWLNDDQHGVARTAARATIFPNGCGLGATWSEETLRAVGSVIGSEARGLHNGFLHAPPASDYDPRSMACNGCGITLYSPNLNLARDPRWGRAQETFGEDPELMSRLVVQFVQGAQQDATPDGGDGALQVGMCCKHAAAYSVEDRPIQRYQFNATVDAIHSNLPPGPCPRIDGAQRPGMSLQVDARELWESYLPAFRACAVEAGATHVMCSYNQAARALRPRPSAPATAPLPF